MTRLASQKAYKKAGVHPDDVQVVELHDCFSANELISYEALGLCGEGQCTGWGMKSCFVCLSI